MTAMPFEPLAFKSQFPLFEQPENHELVYLDNAATSQRPAAVIEAVSRFYLTSNANTHRSSHRLARQATEMVEHTRQLAAEFLNAEHKSEIVFCRGTTEALNLLANTLAEQLQPGDEIVLTRAEHHANLVPWQMAAQRLQLQLKFVPDENGVPDFSRINEVLTERTRIVSLTAASNALGFKTDLPVIQKALAGTNIYWVVDAAQLAAHEVVDVRKIGCDFLVCSAHKFYGPTGIGLLYGKKARLKKLPPWQGGGEMIRKVELRSSSYAEPPHRFETGTSSLAAIAGLEACLHFWQQQDRAAMHKYEKSLTEYLHQQLAELPAIQLLSTPENNVGIATFVPMPEAGYSAADLGHWLDEHDIAVRVGHHCAMPLMDSLTDKSTLRASVAAYNSRSEIDCLIETIAAFEVGGSQKEVAAAQSIFELDDFSGVSIEQLEKQYGWQMRYRQLMKWSELVNAKEEIRSEANLVAGCESDAWLVHRKENSRHKFAIDSDARVVKGLSVLLLLLVNNKTAADIASLPLEKQFADLGLQKHLSESRNNGFRALVDRVLNLASEN